MKKMIFCGFLACQLISPVLFSQDLVIDDYERFNTRNFQVMAFQNEYYEGRRGAIEMVMHGDRVASNGDIRLEPVPIPDDFLVLMPEFVKRTADSTKNEISIDMTYPAIALDYRMIMKAKGKNIRITVNTSRELPDSLVDKIWFMLEIYPGTYKGESFFMDGSQGIFPNQFNGVRDFIDGELEGVPMASGRRLSVAPGDPLHHFTVESVTGDLELLDGRASTNHKWYVIRTAIPAGRTDRAVEWVISPEIHPEWVAEPMVGFSQIGYQSFQKKISVIELDEQDILRDIFLYRITEDGSRKLVKTGTPELWGSYYSKKYARFDFSEVTEEGIYFLEYGDVFTGPFEISGSLYDRDFWRPTMETFIPVQMCHMAVWDRMRMWHGACHLDDARQAPAGKVHFDHYNVLREITTGYEPYEHIPYLDNGGFHDAGDSDIESGSQTSVVLTLSLAYEEFGLQSDQTYVNYNQRLVRLHEPDGNPDLPQQIVHGVKYILGNYRAFGQYSRGTICPEFEQYLQMGDPSRQTDGLIYNPEMAAGESDGTYSGRNDDRLIFTPKNPGSEYGAAMALAAASRALKEYDPQLAGECLNTAMQIWENENTSSGEDRDNPYYRRFSRGRKQQLAIELFLATGREEFREIVADTTIIQGRRGTSNLWSLCRVADKLNDPAFDRMLRGAAERYRERQDAQMSESPYSVPPIHNMFGTGFRFMQVAQMQYYLHKKFPDLFDADLIFDVVAYIHGNHPVSNHSLVNGVGGKSITTAYGFNRADFSYVPGGICPGPLLVRPDLIEFRVDDPFFWVQKEYTIASGASYLFMMLALEEVMRDE